MKQQWRKFDGEIIRKSIQDEVRSMVIREKEMGHKLKVCIGTDSEVKSSITEFATVIAFLRKGNGNFMYIHNEVTKHKISIKQRRLTEMAMSIDIAYSLCNIFTFYNVDMEILADINTNPNLGSNDPLRSATGYISEMNFAFMAKPEVVANSGCANIMLQQG